MGRKSTTLPLLFRDSLAVSTRDAGVYGIINRLNGKIYIGSSVDLSSRKSVHKNLVKSGKHHCRELASDCLNSMSEMEFVVIERTAREPEILRSREQFWTNFYQSYVPELGYNRNKNVMSNRGLKHYPDCAAKISRVNGLRGKKRPPFSEETRKRMSESLKGKRALHKHVPIVRLGNNGEIIKAYDCMADAAKDIGRTTATISYAVRQSKKGLKALCVGSIWKYA